MGLASLYAQGLKRLDAGMAPPRLAEVMAVCNLFEFFTVNQTGPPAAVPAGSLSDDNPVNSAQDYLPVSPDGL